MQELKTFLRGTLLDMAIPYFQTLNVEGRSLYGPSLSTVTPEGGIGDIVTGSRIPPRDIIVHFLIKAPNAQEHLRSVRILNRYLGWRGESRFHFSDERGYRLGHISSVSSPPFDRWQGEGTFTFHCPDPFLHMSMREISGNPVTFDVLDCMAIGLKKVSFMGSGGTVILKNHRTFQRIELEGLPAGKEIIITEKAITCGGDPCTKNLNFETSTWKDFEVWPEDTLEVTGASTTPVYEYERLIL